jgi:hypothetical protein
LQALEPFHVWLLKARGGDSPGQCQTRRFSWLIPSLITLQTLLANLCRAFDFLESSAAPAQSYILKRRGSGRTLSLCRCGVNFVCETYSWSVRLWKRWRRVALEVCCLDSESIGPCKVHFLILMTAIDSELSTLNIKASLSSLTKGASRSGQVFCKLLEQAIVCREDNMIHQDCSYPGDSHGL